MVILDLNNIITALIIIVCCRICCVESDHPNFEDWCTDTHCFWWGRGLKNWTDAQSYCDSYGSSMAEIQDQNTERHLKDFMDWGQVSHIWTGAKLVYPQNENDLLCGSVYYDNNQSKWIYQEISCYYKAHYECFKNQTVDGTCDPGFYSCSGLCIRERQLEAVTWYKAREYCYHGDAVLSVTIDDSSQYDDPLSLPGSCYNRLINPELRYWTKTMNIVYQWNSGDPLSYTNWAPTEPGVHLNSCVALSGRTGWYTYECQHEFHFLCQKEMNSLDHQDILSTFPYPLSTFPWIPHDSPGLWDPFTEQPFILPDSNHQPPVDYITRLLSRDYVTKDYRPEVESDFESEEDVNFDDDLNSRGEEDDHNKEANDRIRQYFEDLINHRTNNNNNDLSQNHVNESILERETIAPGGRIANVTGNGEISNIGGGIVNVTGSGAVNLTGNTKKINHDTNKDDFKDITASIESRTQNERRLKKDKENLGLFIGVPFLFIFLVVFILATAAIMHKRKKRSSSEHLRSIQSVSDTNNLHLARQKQNNVINHHHPAIGNYFLNNTSSPMSLYEILNPSESIESTNATQSGIKAREYTTISKRNTEEEQNDINNRRISSNWSSSEDDYSGRSSISSFSSVSDPYTDMSDLSVPTELATISCSWTRVPQLEPYNKSIINSKNKRRINHSMPNRNQLPRASLQKAEIPSSNSNYIDVINPVNTKQNNMDHWRSNQLNWINVADGPQNDGSSVRVAVRPGGAAMILDQYSKVMKNTRDEQNQKQPSTTNLHPTLRTVMTANQSKKSRDTGCDEDKRQSYRGLTLTDNTLYISS